MYSHDSGMIKYMYITCTLTELLQYPGSIVFFYRQSLIWLGDIIQAVDDPICQECMQNGGVCYNNSVSLKCHCPAVTYGPSCEKQRGKPR